MSNFLFGPFSILINFPYKSVRYLELCYLKLLLCRTIFSVPSAIFGLFPIRYLKLLNEVFELIILFISRIRMLITISTKLFSEISSFFFSKSFRQQHVLSSAKTQGEKFRQEMSGFERPRKRFWNKDVGEKYDAPCPVVMSISMKLTNALNTLQSLSLFRDVGDDML